MLTLNLCAAANLTQQMHAADAQQAAVKKPRLLWTAGIACQNQGLHWYSNMQDNATAAQNVCDIESTVSMIKM